ncbi:TIGR03885 family FMN-dependent LLM class oxidoreductase [Corallococcus aberystwythensis]|uniref:LLM class flavin-dependent oxidoreductase n=1 Tax=Corallococcus aberystwythensis TaxID=2316722 RepID=A0A3A8Q4Q9_9BACT|nr:TIGR03885 family FMN-dependent LLM class oxidoreductase [Corallococcus aberystwythensis]RKH62481.1 LLM class flavin-dependent oxidoreductase [Corallococcus aberystwythensis]
MPLIGFHASHEQFPPSELLRQSQKAEAAGFQAALNSDHFHPWTDAQGQSGFAWAFMGAALATTKLSFGSVTAPGQRYHPAIVAQALATLNEMFPGRAWMALGSGQYLNEAITGTGWPAKDLRNARLKECVDIMRALFRGETVTHRGLVTVEEAKLYTRPKDMPLLVGAAVTPKTARWVAGWADGLITTARPPEELRKVVDAFREGGGEGKPMFLKVQLSFAKDDELAREGAYNQWASNIFTNSVLTDLRTPAQFQEAADVVQPHDLDGPLRVSSSLQQHMDWLGEDLRLGFDRLYLHNVNRDQDAFIDTFGAKVIPALTR